MLDVAAAILHSKLERFLPTGGGIAEKVGLLAQVGPELALENGLHLLGDIHTGRCDAIVGCVNAEAQRRRIA